jgi:ribosomal protein S27AE
MDKYISRIVVGGETYKIRAEVVTVYPTVCPKCGASFTLHYGEGMCEYCGTHYSTKYSLEEVK